MIAKTNQTAIDVTLGLCGSLAGFPTLLTQLDVGTRVGFDTFPELLDVDDIGQTWTPDVQNKYINIALKVYKASALHKAPYGTDLIGLEDAIKWGEDLLPTLFDETGFVHYEYLVDVKPNALKHRVETNQTLVDVVFDLSGSLTAITTLLFQLDEGDRIGFDSIPETWEDTNTIGQTWTPDVQQQYLDINLPVYNLLSVKKKRYNTDILLLLPAITWGNESLAGVIDRGDFLVDDDYVFLTDDDYNHIIT